MKTLSQAAILAVTTLALSTGLARAEMVTGAAITDAISGMTLQGSMLEDGFVEFYAEDGTVAGDGYTGTWRVVEDSVCFAYESAPENCWKIDVNGPAVTLYSDGEVDGVGMLLDGNPNAF